MSNDFYELNPIQAKNDIMSFQLAMKNVSDIFLNGGIEFFKSLDRYWSSPKAVSFYNHFSSLLFEKTVTNILSSSNMLAQEVVNTYNSISTSKGGSSISISHTFYPSDSCKFSVLDASRPNGEIGMNVLKIESAIETYTNCISKGLSALDSVPSNLGIYSKNGDLVTSFYNSIKTIKDNIKSSIDTLIEVLVLYISTEEANINKGIKNADNEF